MKGQIIILLTIITLILITGTCFAESSLYIEYILDASNSMNEKLSDGELKIDAAKRVLSGLIDNIAAERKDANVGLRIYGAKFNPSMNKQEGCLDSVLVAPIVPIDADLIKQEVMAADATGYTPIAYSLELASKDFSSDKENSNMIVLVSDGKESCGGDPVAIAEQLKAQGYDIKIYSIGFDVDTETRGQLEAIALATDGAYYDAKDADQLKQSLEEIKERTFEGYEAAGETAEASLWIADAPEIQTGDFKDGIYLHELKFYKVKVYKGQEVKAIMIVKKSPYEAHNNVINQDFNLQLFDNDFNEVTSNSYMVEGITEDLATFKVEWEADETGWVYVAVSASNNHNGEGYPIPPYDWDVIDPSPYTLKVKISGESTEEVEVPAFEEFGIQKLNGGNSFENAEKVQPDNFITSDIFIKEARFYVMPIEEGLKEIKLTAVIQKPFYEAWNNNINLTYTLKVYDEDWIEIDSDKVVIAMNPPTAQTLTLECEVGGNDEIYISLTASDNHTTDGNTVELYDYNQVSSTNYSLLILGE